MTKSMENLSWTWHLMDMRVLVFRQKLLGNLQSYKYRPHRGPTVSGKNEALETLL